MVMIEAVSATAIKSFFIQRVYRMNDTGMFRCWVSHYQSSHSHPHRSLLKRKMAAESIKTTTPGNAHLVYQWQAMQGECHHVA
jgi:hypothetical protein